MESNQKYDVSTSVCVNSIEFTKEETKEKYKNNLDQFDEEFLSKLGELMRDYGVGSIDCGLSTFWIKGLSERLNS